MPQYLILDIPRVGLKLACITPFRSLGEGDLLDYSGHHPRKLGAIPLPEYHYRLYGLEKSGETASEMLRIRVTPSDKAAIEEQAKAAGLTPADYMRQAILTYRD
jgi:hypothetical protein